MSEIKFEIVKKIDLPAASTGGRPPETDNIE
jgi:hypothetical protein